MVDGTIKQSFEPSVIADRFHQLPNTMFDLLDMDDAKIQKELHQWYARRACISADSSILSKKASDSLVVHSCRQAILLLDLLRSCWQGRFGAGRTSLGRNLGVFANRSRCVPLDSSFLATIAGHSGLRALLTTIILLLALLLSLNTSLRFFLLASPALNLFFHQSPLLSLTGPNMSLANTRPETGEKQSSSTLNRAQLLSDTMKRGPIQSLLSLIEQSLRQLLRCRQLTRPLLAIRTGSTFRPRLLAGSLVDADDAIPPSPRHATFTEKTSAEHPEAETNERQG
jgi:hypothetical protein